MPDLDTVFQARGCSVAHQCQCMYYRRSGGSFDDWSDEAAIARSRKSLLRLSKQDPPPGLIGYRDGVPVGWVSLGPRADYKRLARSTTMKPVDELPVWSIVCFVVPSAYRGQGVAHELLTAAVAYAKARGVMLLEAYPVDRSVPKSPQAPWFGSLSMFEKAGFEEVARRKASRPIVRLHVANEAPCVKPRKTASPSLTDDPVGAYIAEQAGEVQVRLHALRDAVRAAAPKAREAISYRIPAYFGEGGVLVYFAAFKKHIGLFPPVQTPALLAKVTRYAGPKGNLRFPLDEPLPLDLITRIVKARVAEQAKLLRKRRAEGKT